MLLTPNFTLAEFTASATARSRGIDNTPSAAVVTNITALCRNLLQPFRDLVGRPLTVNSGYRCPALNAAVGGVKNSQHLTGQAADIHIPTIAAPIPGARPITPGPLTPLSPAALGRQWIQLITTARLPFDQIILEHNARGSYWLHLSYSTTRNRRQIIYK